MPHALYAGRRPLERPLISPPARVRRASGFGQRSATIAQAHLRQSWPRQLLNEAEAYYIKSIQPYSSGGPLRDCCFSTMPGYFATFPFKRLGCHRLKEVFICFTSAFLKKVFRFLRLLRSGDRVSQICNDKNQQYSNWNEKRVQPPQIEQPDSKKCSHQKSQPECSRKCRITEIFMLK
jgi:hypothetical protein